MKKDYSISCIRGIATLLVVGIHIAQRLSLTYPRASLISDWGNIGLVMFFVISAFLYSKRRIEKPVIWFAKRYFEIAIPSIIVVVLFLIIYQMIVGGLYFERIINAILSGLGFEEFVSDPWMFVQLWYLSYILICYLSVPFILTILKGCAAAMYYPEPLQRTMGDIDFIVTPERFEDARRLMEDNGYKFDHDLGNDREYSYCKGDIILELHHRYSDVGWDIDPLIMDGLTHPVISELYGKAFPALPVEINGLVLLDHIRHHIRQGLGIRQIIDWMMFLHSFEGDDVWNSRFAPLVREAGLETFAATVTKMCRCWFGLPDEITWCDHADDDLAQELLETLFQFGNFGNKTSQEERPVETVTMNIRKKGLFRYLQTVGVSNWKACQKHKILQPFAWLYQIFRYIVKGFTELFRGEKIVKDLKRGNKKSDFMKKTGIEKRVDS